MSPWDDAQQLLKLQKATDWSASELARQIGRVSEGERTGLRDVQQKLKIAREATPEAVAEYERTGSWDTLRASVTTPTPKPQTIGEQVAQHGAAVLSESPQNESLSEAFTPWATPEAVQQAPLCTYVPGEVYQPRQNRWKPERTVADVAPELTAAGVFAEISEAAEGGEIETLALPWSRPGRYSPHRFPQAQIQIAKLRGHDAWISEGGYSLSDIGNHNQLTGVGLDTAVYQDRRSALMAAIDDIAEGITRNKNGRIPSAIGDWLLAPRPLGPHVVQHVDYLNESRANEARRSLGLLPPLPTPNYGSSPRPEARPGPPAQTPAVPVSTPEDDQRPVTPEQDAPAPVTRDAPPALPPASVMSAHLKALVQSREHPTNAALRLIADERKRQVEAEGFTPETDDRDNADLELAYGAAAYAASAAGDADASLFWPSGWNPYLFKPTGDVRDLVRAGALIVAELERRAREAAASHPALLEAAQ